MAVFSYLEELLRADSVAAARMRAIPINETHRVELPGGAFALEQVYLSKVRAAGFFESHRKFIDVQVVFEGEEAMEVVDLSRTKVQHAYDAQRDLLIYEDRPASLLRIASGDGAIFYPSDIHMPGLCGDAGPALVRKTVVKVPVS